jgi:hypothetical protein
MKRLVIAAAILSAASTSAFAKHERHHEHDDRYSAAPGPIVGAGLPALAFGIGYGVYWLRQRRRRTD